MPLADLGSTRNSVPNTIDENFRYFPEYISSRVHEHSICEQRLISEYISACVHKHSTIDEDFILFSEYSACVYRHSTTILLMISYYFRNIFRLVFTNANCFREDFRLFSGYISTCVHKHSIGDNFILFCEFMRPQMLYR